MALAIWTYPQQLHFSLAEGALREHAFLDQTNMGHCFVVKAFEPNSPLYSIAIEQVVQAKTANELLENRLIKPTNSATAFLLPSFKSLIETAVETLKSTSAFQKVVLSRFVDVEFDVLNLQWLDMLKLAYPNAFISLFHHQNLGTWLTASPEILLKRHKNQFSSFSLAGTKFSNNSALGQKEHIEQSIVTSFIKEVMETNGLQVLVQNEVEHKAGALTHLLNIVEGYTQSKAINLHKLLVDLHPSPAVGGNPKEQALEYIKAEMYNRELYTGFLGEFTHAQNFEFYVNLRCAQLFKNAIRFYAGAGITQDSIAENEYLETEAKMEVLKSVLLSRV